MEDIRKRVSDHEAGFKNFLLGKAEETTSDKEILELLKKQVKSSNNPADITEFLYKNPIFTSQSEDLTDTRSVEEILTDAPESLNRTTMMELLDKLMLKLLNKDFLNKELEKTGGGLTVSRLFDRSGPPPEDVIDTTISRVKVEGSFDTEFESYFDFHIVFTDEYMSNLAGEDGVFVSKHDLRVPTTCISYFVAGDELTATAFDKYIFNIIYNLICFYMHYPNGKCRVLLDREGGMQKPISSFFPNMEEFIASFLNYTRANRSAPSPSHPNVTGYDFKTLLTEIVTSLTQYIRTETNELRTDVSLNDFFVYIMSLVAGNFLDSGASILIIDYERKDKSIPRLGINPVGEQASLRCSEQDGYPNGFIGQVMRYLFFRQKRFDFSFQPKGEERSLNFTFEPMGLGCSVDAHATGYTKFLQEEINAFSENFINNAQSTGVDHMYLITVPPTYGAWHPRQNTCPSSAKRRGILAGLFFGIGGNERTTIITDSDYNNTIRQLFDDRFQRDDGRGDNCKFNYGNDEYVLANLLQKYNNSENVIYMNTTWDLLDLTGSLSQLKYSLLYKLFLHYRTRFTTTGTHSQIREIKSFMATDNEIPYYMKIFTPDTINGIYCLNNQINENNNNDYGRLYKSLENVGDFLVLKSKIIDTPLTGMFNLLHENYIKKDDYKILDILGISMQTWCQDAVNPRRPGVSLRTYVKTYPEVNKQEAIDRFLYEMPKKYYDIESIRNYNKPDYTGPLFPYSPSPVDSSMPRATRRRRHSEVDDSRPPATPPHFTPERKDVLQARDPIPPPSVAERKDVLPRKHTHLLTIAELEELFPSVRLPSPLGLPLLGTRFDHEHERLRSLARERTLLNILNRKILEIQRKRFEKIPEDLRKLSFVEWARMNPLTVDQLPVDQIRRELRIALTGGNKYKTSKHTYKKPRKLRTRKHKKVNKGFNQRRRTYKKIVRKNPSTRKNLTF